MKPILFNTEMVRAILDRRKTMTRRIVKPQPSSGIRKSVFVKSGLEDGHGREIKPRYQPSDILWVRETWLKADDGYYYKADIEVPSESEDLRKTYGYKWRSPIFMPREAARLFLRVKNVRVERLQDITPKDAWEEGCRIGNSFPWEEHIPELQRQCRDALFIPLWNKINSKRGYGWDVNPWVWVYEFEIAEVGK